MKDPFGFETGPVGTTVCPQCGGGALCPRCGRVQDAFDTELADEEWQGEISRSSPDYIRWVQHSLNRVLGLRLAVDGILGPLTRSAIRSFQTGRGLAVDGIVGPQTEPALTAAGAGPPPGAPGTVRPVAPAGGVGASADASSFLVGHMPLRPPTGLTVTNYLDPSVHRFRGRNRGGRAVNEFVIHETVTRSVADTVSVLIRRNLGVHLILAPDGQLTQHGDLADDNLAHAGGHNGVSVGVEVVNPYYPKYLRPGLPWTRVIEAGWAHEGRYVVPTPEQAEAVALLTGWITSPGAQGLAIPRTWIGLSNARLAMGRAPGGEQLRPGVYAHTYFGHADGPWLVLYAWLRLEAGRSPRQAYEEAIRLATTPQRWVSLPGSVTPAREPSDEKVTLPRRRIIRTRPGER